MKQLAFFVLAAVCYGQDLQPLALPKPQTDGGRPLMRVLADRKSTREFTAGKLSRQVLSNLLWAAWGVNRADGRRTAPSASNRQEIDIYVAAPEGLYLYEAKEQRLQPVVGEDLRAQAGTQAYVKDAAVNLVYVADLDKMGQGSDDSKLVIAAYDTGFIAENVYLYCASEGLGVVVRASVDRAALAKSMKLRPTQRITLSQSVGLAK
jgi:nitroreductase